MLSVYSAAPADWSKVKQEEEEQREKEFMNGKKERMNEREEGKQEKWTYNKQERKMNGIKNERNKNINGKNKHETNKEWKRRSMKEWIKMEAGKTKNKKESSRQEEINKGNKKRCFHNIFCVGGLYWNGQLITWSEWHW